MRSLTRSQVVGILLFAAACLFGAAGCAKAQAQTLVDPPTSALTEPEYRAMWVTTAYNNDWPSKAALHRRVQKDEILAIVKRAKDLKCNLILLQVRAFGDRIYKDTSLATDSKNKTIRYFDEPWAQALNYDNPPDPGGVYDPFQEWINICNEEGIELHAWINPYRINKLVTVIERVEGKDVEHYLPVIKWKKQLYLDPTHIEVQNYVKAVIEDFLKHYPPEKNPHTTVVSAGMPQQAMMLGEEDGPEGVIYDHQIPEPPDGGGGGPGTQPSTRPFGPGARLALMQATKTSAEKRYDYLKDTIYPQKKPLPVNTAGKVSDFLTWSYDTVTGAGGKFGLSPLGNIKDDYYAKFQLDKDKVDYLIPEVYVLNQTDFQTRLKAWLDRAKDRVEVITGLNTAAVQTPASDANEDVWQVKDITDQMTLSRATEGPVSKKKPVGDAHFSAYGLRLEAQGGPKDDRNLGKKLKEDKYKAAKLPPKHPRGNDAGNGNAPGEPKNFQLDARPDGEYVTWQKGSGRRPRRWQVWVWRQASAPSPGWDEVEILGEDKPEKKIDADVKAVWVKAVDKFNRPSADYGKWSRP